MHSQPIANRIDSKKGANTLKKGGGGDKILISPQGNDYLNCSKGENHLYGSKGSGTLIGAGDADIFQLSKSNNTVEDFNIEKGDRIALDETSVFKVFNETDIVNVQSNSDHQL